MNIDDVKHAEELANQYGESMNPEGRMDEHYMASMEAQAPLFEYDHQNENQRNENTVPPQSANKVEKTGDISWTPPKSRSEEIPAAWRWEFAESQLIARLLMVDMQSDQEIVSAAKEAWATLDEKDFFNSTTRGIFVAGKDLWEKDVNSFTAPAVYDRYIQANRDDDRSVYRWLVDLIKNTITPSSGDEIISFVERVRKGRIERNLLKLTEKTQNIIKNGYLAESDNAPKDIVEMLVKMDGWIDKSMTLIPGSRNEFVTMNEALQNALNQIEKWYEDDREVTGLPSGFDELDKLTTGFQKGDLVIVAGRPGMGKTAFATSMIANHVNNKSEDDEPFNVALFSLEMSHEQIVLRLISTLSNVPFMNIRKGKVLPDDLSKITMAMGKLNKMNMLISDKGSTHIKDMRLRVMEMNNKIQREGGKGLDLIVVDYLQLMSGSGKNRVEEISDISRSLKLLAKEIGCPVIALSQLNRSLEQRPDRRPRLSDLRESGSIEQDADIIIMLYRDDVYNKDSEMKGLAEINIAKNRHGPTETVVLNYRGESFRFFNRVPEQDDY